MTGHQTRLMTINLASGVLTLVLCWIGARNAGLLGVAAASSVGMTLQNVALWLATWHATGLWTHVGPIRPAELRQVLGFARPR